MPARGTNEIGVTSSPAVLTTRRTQWEDVASVEFERRATLISTSCVLHRGERKPPPFFLSEVRSDSTDDGVV